MKSETNLSRACRIVLLLSRVGLGGMLLWTGIPKIVDPATFMAAITRYELVSPRTAQITAMTLPWIEFLTGVCLLAGIRLPAALLTCAGMMVLFVFAQSSVLARGLSIECGCGLTSDGSPISTATVFRSMMLLSGALVGYGCALASFHTNASAAPSDVSGGTAVLPVANQ